MKRQFLLSILPFFAATPALSADLDGPIYGERTIIERVPPRVGERTIIERVPPRVVERRIIEHHYYYEPAPTYTERVYVAPEVTYAPRVYGYYDGPYHYAGWRHRHYVPRDHYWHRRHHRW
jgi:hypothetical protein